MLDLIISALLNKIFESDFLHLANKIDFAKSILKRLVKFDQGRSKSTFPPKMYKWESWRLLLQVQENENCPFEYCSSLLLPFLLAPSIQSKGKIP